MNGSFEAQVTDFVNKSQDRILAVFKQSAQEVFSNAQTTYNSGGHLPIDLGTLRNSFISALNGSSALTGPDSYQISIAGAKLGDVVFGGWTVDYARRMEYGFHGTDALGRTYNQDGFGFVRHAVAEWQSIVTRNAVRLAA